MNNLKSRKISFILALIMIISSIVSIGNITSVFANDGDIFDLEEKNEVNEGIEEFNYSSRDVSNVVNSIEIINENQTFYPGSDVEFKLTFSDGDELLKEGDYIEVKLSHHGEATPKFYNNEVVLHHEEDGEVLGKATANNDTLKITFNNSVEKYDLGTISGYLNAKLKIDNIHIDNDNEISITGGKITKQVTVKKPTNTGGENPYYYKGGYSNTENPEVLSWYLVIDALGRLNIENTIIISDEIIDKTHKYDRDSFYLYNSETKLDNIDGIDIEFINDYEFRITIKPENITDDSIDINNLSIQYNTIIVNRNKNEYKNNSKITGIGSNPIESDSSIKNPFMSAGITGAMANELLIHKVLKGSYDETTGKYTPIKDVIFQVVSEDKKFNEEIKTNEEGYASLKKLSAGKYYVYEISAPGYKFDPEKSYEVIIEDGKGYDLQIENEREEKNTNLKIIKYIENTEKPLKGVEFKILDSNKKVIESVKTNENGEAIVENLKNGTYYIEEKLSTKLELNENNQVKLIINDDSDDNITQIIYNKIKRKDFIVQKIWKGTIQDKIELVLKNKNTGKEISRIVMGKNENPNWESKFEGINIYDDNLEKIEFELLEIFENSENYEVVYEEIIDENEELLGFKVTNTEKKEPNKPDAEKPSNPDPYEPEDRPYERPGNPTKPKEETRPKEPNKNEPIKPEEPKEVEVEEIEEVEEPRESNINSNKVESNKKEKEEEIKIVTEKPKENINVFDENKAPQTGDEFSLVLNILVLMASILGLYVLSKKRK